MKGGSNPLITALLRWTELGWREDMGRLVRVGAAAPYPPEHPLQVLISAAQLVEMLRAELQAGSAGENGNLLPGCRFRRHGTIPLNCRSQKTAATTQRQQG